MTIAHDATGTAIKQTASATSATVDITAAAVGAWCYFGGALGANQTGVTFANWTQVLEGDESTATHYFLWRRQKQSGDTTFTVSWPTSTRLTGNWESYTGPNGSTPDELAAFLAHTTSVGFTTQTLTPGGAGRWSFMFSYTRDTTLATDLPDGSTWTPDAALTERTDASNAAAATSPWLSVETADSNGIVTVAAQQYTATCAHTESHGGTILLFLVPPPSVSGTIQPATAVPAPRRPPRRAVVQFTPVRTTNAIPPPVPSGTVQPPVAVPAPRRPPRRAVVQFTPVRTTNALVFAKAPLELPRTWPRRPPSRAVVIFRPVRTTNKLAPRNLLVSIAAARGTDDYGNIIRDGLTSYDPGGNYTQSAVGVINLSSGSPSTPAQIFPGSAGELVVSSGQVTPTDPTAQLLLLSAAANAGTAELAILAPVVQLTNAAPGTIPVTGVSGSLITVPHNPNDPTYGGAGGTLWISGERLVLDNQIDNINSNFVLIINALKQAGVIT